MIDLFLLWTESNDGLIYQQPVDKNVNNIIPLCITFINKSLHLWMDERLTPIESTSIAASGFAIVPTGIGVTVSGQPYR